MTRRWPFILMLPSSLTRSVLAIALLAIGATAGLAADSKPAPAAGGVISYFRDVRPIFQTHCQGCHQPAKPMGDLVMTHFEGMLKGGESGEPAVVPGKPEASNLLAQVTPTDGKAEMPKDKDPLSETEIKLIRQWIAEGAIDDTPTSVRAVIDMQHPPAYEAAPVITSLDFSPDDALLAISGYHEVLLYQGRRLGAGWPGWSASRSGSNRPCSRPTANRWP